MNDPYNQNDLLILNVVLPDQKVTAMSIGHSTPMMDLLVHVASECKLKPGEHVISIFSEDTGRPIEYQSSQTIGSLSVSTIYLQNKVMQKKEKEKEMQMHRDASKFEPTIRVTINMPRGVKSLQRMNPNIPIMDLFRKICIDKGLDASRYEVRLTKQTHTTVDMSLTLNDYHTSEITIKQCSAPDFHSSMIDISRSTIQSNRAANMPEQLERVKKKKGIFAFLSRKEKRTIKKMDESRNFSKSVHALPIVGGVTQAPRKPQAQVKPQPKVQPTIQEEQENDVGRNKAKRAPSKKKYRAPVPPAKKMNSMLTISEEKKNLMYASTPNLMTDNSTRVNDDPSILRTVSIVGEKECSSSNSHGYQDASSFKVAVHSVHNTSHYSTEPRHGNLPAGQAAQGQSSRSGGTMLQRSQTLPTGASLALSNKRSGRKKPAPAPPPLDKQYAAVAQHSVNNRIVESEEETASLSSQNDEAPEHGVRACNTSAELQNPPIFIPPPPPSSPPPAEPTPILPTQDTSPLGSSQPFSSPVYILDYNAEQTAIVTPTLQECAPNVDDALPVLYNRSESRCSRASVNTIDDVQQYFDSAIAAGEKQLRHEQIENPERDSFVSQRAHSLSDETREIMVQPTQEDINEAVAQIDMCLGEDDGSDSSLVPDGENYIVADVSSVSKGNEKYGSDDSAQSESNCVKPVEELSYGFDNPFLNGAAEAIYADGKVVLGGVGSSDSLNRRDSQISDSTLPDSEHTADRPHSSSLHSSAAQSDEEGSVTEEGDGYETPAASVSNQRKSKPTAQLDREETLVNDKDAANPSVVQSDMATVSMPVTLQQDKDSNIWRRNSQMSSISQWCHPSLSGDNTENSKRKSVIGSVKPMQGAGDNSVQTSDNQLNCTTNSPITQNVKPLSTVLVDSMNCGKEEPIMRLQESANPIKPMFFRASRSSRIDKTSDPSRIENVIKLDSNRFSRRIEESSMSSTKPVEEVEGGSKEEEAVNKPTHKVKSVSRKESLRDQYDKLQENMTMWQNKLKNNESRVKALTTSQQNISKLRLHGSGSDESSSSISTSVKRPFTSSSIYQSVPDELHKVTLKSAAQRLIIKAPVELDPVESLMKSIRDRGGKTDDRNAERDFYVAGESNMALTPTTALRELAPSVLRRHADTLSPAMVQPYNTANTEISNKEELMNATTRDSLLTEIVGAKGKPRMRNKRRTMAVDSSSSHSSSDELREIEVRNKTPRMRYKNSSKRSVSDPFPPKQSTGRTQHRPTTTELDPREELMIAIRNSGGMGRLCQVNADEIKWSTKV